MSIRALGAILLLSLVSLFHHPVSAADSSPAGWTIDRSGPIPQFIPDDLQPGETLTFALLPAPEAKGDDLEAALRGAMQRDEANFGRIEQEGTVTRNSGVVATARTLKDKQGRVVHCAYFAFSDKAGKTQVTRVLAAPTPTIYQRYLSKITALHVLVRAGTLPVTPIAPPPVATPKVAGPAAPPKPASTTGQKPAPTPAAPVGKRLDPARIEGVYFVPAYGLGVGGFVTSNFRPYLLLKDGTLTKISQVAPEEVDVERSRREAPKDWGRWTRQGETFVVNWKQGKPETWKTWYVGFPARAGETLSGKYYTIGGGGNVAFGGGVMILAAETVRFSPNGQFSLERKSGASSEEAGPFGTRTGGSTTAGTYQLNGYTLTLKYGDGRVERRPFLFYSKKKQKDPTAIFIGDDSYVQRK